MEQLALANRNNNPGNLRDTSTGKFRQFNSPQEGYAALLNDLEIKKTGQSKTGLTPDSTLADFAKVYAPSSDKNDPAQYTANLANHMKVRPDARLRELNTGSWAEAVAKAEGYKGQESAKTQTPTPDVSQGTQPDNKDLLQKTTDVFNSIFPGKQVGEAIGTLGGLGIEKLKGLFGGQDNSEYYDLSAPTPLQVAGDVAQGALTVAPGLGAVKAFGKTIPALKTASSVAGRIGQSGLLGAGLGATQALKEEKTNLGDIGKQTATGGLVGGVLGGAGEAITKVAQTLPKWIASRFITGKGVGEKQIEYAVNKGLGTPEKMLAQSEKSIGGLGNELGSILSKPEYKGIQVTGKDLYQRFAQENPQAGILPDEFFKEIKKLSGLKRGLVDKLETGGGLSLPELQELNHELGENVFKSVLDAPEVKTGKKLGSNVYHAIGDAIRSIAPENGRTDQIYSELSKEYPLNGALQRLIRRGETSKSITLKEIMTFLGGSTFGGPMAGLSAVGMEKLATNPSVNLKTAGLINSLAKPNAQGIGTVSKPFLMKSLNGLFGGNVNIKKPKENQ